MSVEQRALIGSRVCAARVCVFSDSGDGCPGDLVAKRFILIALGKLEAEEGKKKLQGNSRRASDGTYADLKAVLGCAIV